MKLGTQQRACLMEAARRYCNFHRGADPIKAWTGLGTKTAYKPVLDAELMEFVHDYNTRCIGWLRLTEKGLDALIQVLEGQ